MTDNNKDDQKDHWQSFTEEVEVAGQNLVEEVTRLIAEGNVRKLRIRSENDDIALEVPLTAGAVLGGVVVLGAPWLVLLGAIAGLLTKVRIEIVRKSDPEAKNEPLGDTPKED